MDNAAIAEALVALARQAERSGDAHRSRAFRNAAQVIRELPRPLEDDIKAGRSPEGLPHIGPGITSRLVAMVRDGHSLGLHHGGEPGPAPRTLAPATTSTSRPSSSSSRRRRRSSTERATQPRPALAKALRGDLHCHTTATDGRHDLTEMVAAAQSRGYAYVAITDHSKDTRVAGGLSEERMKRHLDAIRRIDEASPGIRVLAGAEVDILKDGRLDYPDALLRDMDVVLCSVHFRHQLDGPGQTKRILRGMSNPCAHILGHPTGRRLGIRPPMDLDIPRLAEAAHEGGWCLEMNGSPERLDLDAQGAAIAKQNGVPIVLDSDAHATWEFANVDHAAREAEAAGLGPNDVLNCLDLEGLQRRLRR